MSRWLAGIVVASIIAAAGATVARGLAGVVLASTTYSVTASTSGASFTPSTLTIHVGDTVNVSRADGGNSPHNIHWADQAQGCPPLPTTTAWSCSRTFDSPGVFVGVCDAHPSMTLTVTVQAPATPTPTPTTTTTTPTKTPGPTKAPGPTGTPGPTATAASTVQPSPTANVIPGSPAAAPTSVPTPIALVSGPPATTGTASPPSGTGGAGQAGSAPAGKSPATVPLRSSGRDGDTAPIVLSVLLVGAVIGGTVLVRRRMRSAPPATEA